MASNPKGLILDEPTEPFQHDDTRQLFDVIRSLRDAGAAIVYVSHRLHEVTELADRISIMRDGERVASRMAQDITETEIVSRIAGRPLAQMFPPKGDGLGAPIVQVSVLAGPGFHDITLAARAGEIVGLAGVEGEGQREVLRARAGVHPHSAGLITLDGKTLTLSGPGAARSCGIGFVPDDRHAEGLFLNLSVRENLGIGVLDQIASGCVVRRPAEAALATGVVNALRVRTPSIKTTVSELSGGNQQKVLFGREISAGSRVLLVDEPTKGVDIGARSEIYQRLRTLADSGTARSWPRPSPPERTRH